MLFLCNCLNTELWTGQNITWVEYFPRKRFKTFMIVVILCNIPCISFLLSFSLNLPPPPSLSIEPKIWTVMDNIRVEFGSFDILTHVNLDRRHFVVDNIKYTNDMISYLTNNQFSRFLNHPKLYKFVREIYFQRQSHRSPNHHSTPCVCSFKLTHVESFIFGYIIEVRFWTIINKVYLRREIILSAGTSPKQRKFGGNFHKIYFWSFLIQRTKIFLVVLCVFFFEMLKSSRIRRRGIKNYAMRSDSMKKMYEWNPKSKELFLAVLFVAVWESLNDDITKGKNIAARLHNCPCTWLWIGYMYYKKVVCSSCWEQQNFDQNEFTFIYSTFRVNKTSTSQTVIERDSMSQIHPDIRLSGTWRRWPCPWSRRSADKLPRREKITSKSQLQ